MEMSEANATGYLPGDPRYGLQGEALANYYRTKAAQWAIYCWDIGERSDAVLRTAIGERSDAVLRTAIGERSDAVLPTAMGERSDAVLRTAMGERSDAVLRTAMEAHLEEPAPGLDPGDAGP